MAMTDIGPAAPPTHLLRRGDWRQKDREILPGYLSAIEDCEAPIPDLPPGSRTTGRRSVLAQWLTRPDNPLTARVIANHVICDNSERIDAFKGRCIVRVPKAHTQNTMLFLAPSEVENGSVRSKEQRESRSAGNITYQRIRLAEILLELERVQPGQRNAHLFLRVVYECGYQSGEPWKTSYQFA